MSGIASVGFFPTEDIFNIKKIRFNTRKNNFKIIDSVKIYIFCIQKNPEEGEWTLANNGANAVSVNVTAQSALDFSSSILEISTGGESYQLSGNPIKGLKVFHDFTTAYRTNLLIARKARSDNSRLKTMAIVREHFNMLEYDVFLLCSCSCIVGGLLSHKQTLYMGKAAPNAQRRYTFRILTMKLQISMNH